MSVEICIQDSTSKVVSEQFSRTVPQVLERVREMYKLLVEGSEDKDEEIQILNEKINILEEKNKL